VRFTSASSLWFAEHPSARSIVITGTKGKSTTTALTRHLLEACGVRAVAAGNIGRSLLDCEPEEADWWVIELSSYQICDLEARPSLAALLNLSDEHLDWHRGAANYRRDKLRLAELVPPGRLLVNKADTLLCETLLDRPGFSEEAARRIVWFGCETGFHQRDGKLWRGHRCLLERSPSMLPGTHNLTNLAAALAIVDQALGGAPERLLAGLSEVLEGFRGLPHRLHPLGRRHGLDWYDDSLATTPVATLAALEALVGRPVTVLVGGLDRGLDWRVLAPRFVRLAPHAILGMPDSGRAVIDALRAEGLAPPAGMRAVGSLAEAVALAVDITPEGGVVLLSPGAPSFPQFRDYRERGERFAEFAGFGPGVP
jgi:UDP-N-acetylmuramoylalanine--D-glutamate ligase